MEAFHITHIIMCPYLTLIFFSSLTLYTAYSSFPSSCKLWRKFELNEMHKTGDVVFGGLFEVHYTSVFPVQTFTTEPQQASCKG